MRSIRRSRNITQAALAALAGLTQPFISDFEHGYVSLRAGARARLAAALNIAEADL